MINLLGKVFSPVKSDINGNVDKIRKAYQLQPDAYRHLNDLIIIEAPKKMSSVSLEALLWLKRGLEFMFVFLNDIVEDKETPPSENISAFCCNAYEKTLKPYHGWIVQSLFQLCSKACPYRKNLLKAIALQQDGMEDVIIEEAKIYLRLLKQDLDVLNKLYAHYDLDDKRIV
ncbi:glycolipid transfer protein-like isoform X2 [Artemia franciscana]|uniref:Glycolipid transfer protein domain-containing protein n=1 Tax=Artemia franciscana TaxID=6661 RepID=A0AA88HJK1_ARTSF|nr:hypothetical protein QYM36_011914 [Artemia franciscana]